MRDSVLSEAIAKRDAAEAEFRRWSDFIKMYGELTAKPSGAPMPDASIAATGALTRTAAVAIEIIASLNRPVPTPELRAELEARGVEVGGKNPDATLSARLSRAEGIVNIRQKGWWIKGKLGDAHPSKEPSPSLFPSSPPEGREGSVAHVVVEPDKPG